MELRFLEWTTYPMKSHSLDLGPAHTPRKACYENWVARKASYMHIWLTGRSSTKFLRIAGNHILCVGGLLCTWANHGRGQLLSCGFWAFRAALGRVTSTQLFFVSRYEMPAELLFLLR